MMKIYLDQNYYINIANGILGDTRFDDDVQGFEYLLSLVNKDIITIYYSWVHLSETLRHVNLITDSFRLQCEVLDKLTKGNCFFQINRIIQNEIKYFLLEQFKKEEIDVSNNYFEYAYGTHSDCIAFDLDIDYARENMSPEFKRAIKGKVYSKSRKNLNKLFPNANGLTKKEIIRLLTFDKDAVKKYFDSTFGFKALILRYRDYFSKFGDMNELPNSRAKMFLEVMEHHRKRIILGFESINEIKDPIEKQKIKNIVKKKLDEFFLEVQELISSHYQKNILRHIKPFLDSKKIDEIEALKSLQNFDHILGVRFYKDLLNEYFIRNSGFTPNPRKADVNDHFDVEHLRHLPYVDCFVTERFFGDIAVKLAAKYNSKVFKNLNELRPYLDSIE